MQTARWLALGMVVGTVVLGCGSGSGGGADGPSGGDGPGGDGPGGCSFGTGWTSAPAILGGPVQETAVVAVDGRVYVIGGFDGNIGVVDAVRVFDTRDCTWSDGPALPAMVHHANAAVVDGTIYVLGAMQGVTFARTGVVWRYNPATDTQWTARTSMPTGTERGSAVTAAIGNVIYVAGGLAQGAVATVSAYDTVNDAWDTTLPALPQPRDHGCGGVVGGRLYVMGGRTGTPDNPSGEVYVYEPGGAWMQVSTLPTARGGTACGIVNDTIFVIGGEGNAGDPSGVFPQVEGFVPATGDWNLQPDMPNPRHGTGAAAWNGVIYVPAGADVQQFGAVATHDALRP
jgi:N-acetylneuraminic acid mutarotase